MPNLVKTINSPKFWPPNLAGKQVEMAITEEITDNSSLQNRFSGVFIVDPEQDMWAIYTFVVQLPFIGHTVFTERIRLFCIRNDFFFLINTLLT